jgi:hypothetical protein
MDKYVPGSGPRHHATGGIGEGWNTEYVQGHSCQE